MVNESLNEILFIMKCGHLKEGSMEGLQKNQGEITLQKIYKVNGGMYNLIYSWRGDKFDINEDDESKLPVTSNIIQEHIKLLEKTSFCSKENLSGICGTFKEVIQGFK